MSRGYRSIIVAAVGWLTLCAQHPNPAPNPPERQSDARVGDALTNIATTYRDQAERAQRAPERQPCGPAEYKSNDELCAQWKAADAAEKSAWWAAFAGWFGGLSFIGVLAAVALAFHSNWIARDTAKRQLRAYMSVDPKGVFQADENGDVTVSLLLSNNGQTPAYHVEIDSWFSLSADPIDFDPSRANRAHIDRRPSDFTFGPGEKNHVFFGMPFSPLPQQMEEIAVKKLAIVHYGVVRYEDAFGEWRQSEFAHYHRGEELSDAEAKRCRLGNHAT